MNRADDQALTEQGQRAANEAIAAVARAAGQAWVGEAYRYLERYSAQHPRFLIDDVRRAALEDGVTEPHDPRAWGAVTRMAVKAKLIQQDGYAAVKRAHMRPMPVWVSLSPELVANS